ncbi:RNA polymerase sigma factor [Sporosarcina limicola]|uniref:RNA polymerase sigma-70 factor (ECF subfamily) n=1 Tax=Sporosarcina limicola TaxID=34101 RepID=A0A927ML94_9BACL|nr:RNA polymerase sigma factor [Sporosarcina limicola]MBE1556673.1 RNA polymerase sigma-70 factor (ECF subfamily) [Sporosarcina limicola]
MRPLVKSTPIGMNEEFEDVIQPYMRELRNYCTSLTKSSWDGDDLMQETLAKAYRSWLKKQKPIAKAYLFRIASNTWIDAYRKRKLDEEMNPDFSGFKQVENAVSDATIKAIEVILTELTPKQRAIVLFVEAFGYSAKEIARMIDTSEGAVKATLHRARRKLKQINYDSHVFYSEEEETLTYVTALRNGDSVAIVRLYQNEMIEPQMATSSSQKYFKLNSGIQFFAGGSTYVLFTISMKNGSALCIPFYQIELAALLSRLEELKREIPIVA